jgi:integrase
MSKRKKAVVDLTTKTGRRGLAVQREPHWMKLGRGFQLGFRRGPDAWVVRYFTRQGKYEYHALGQHEDFSDAKKAAESWLLKMSGGAHRVVQRGSVADGLLAYIENLKELGRPEAAATALEKFKTTILGNPESKRANRAPRHELADKSLERCAREDFTGWRKSLVKRGVSNQTVNRYIGCVTAGLNAAVEQLGHVGNPAAWTFPDLEEEEAEGETAVYLTPEQRARLTAHLPAYLQLFVNLMNATGGRTSEIAKATVADYDARHHTLVLRWKKGRPAKWKARTVHLDAADKALFKAAIEGKLPGAFLAPDEDGGQLVRHDWADGIRAAIAYANSHASKKDPLIPVDATAYSYRHTRISELLQVYNFDALTVANETGTSLAMMKKYYWKWVPGTMQKKFDAAKG